MNKADQILSKYLVGQSAHYQGEYPGDWPTEAIGCIEELAETLTSLEENPVGDTIAALRDQFAEAALQGLLASLSTEYACKNLTEEMEYRGDPKRRPEWTLSRAAYDYADAMIVARKGE